jgi:2-polyprenyl-3-methyl-5-hydroxy-6-metoxy-1,4-benzoquinol methylase
VAGQCPEVIRQASASWDNSAPPEGQQLQTKSYFEGVACEWQEKSAAGDDYSVIRARNGAVLEAIRRHGKAGRFLDVGCGTGQLVLEVGKTGTEAVGVDFARHMIAQCEANRAGAGVPATFIAGSFFDMPAQGKFDVISALGFIEYICAEQLEEFFTRCFELLNSGGALLVGSRNRLFNVVSLNEFSRIEMALGVFDQLAAEAVTLHLSRTQTQAFDDLRRHERIYPQPTTHPMTGVRVDVRYQYSPAELTKRLRGHHFCPSRMFPVHFHALPTELKSEHLDAHFKIARMVHGLAPMDQRLIPHCSSYVMEAGRV